MSKKQKFKEAIVQAIKESFNISEESRIIFADICITEDEEIIYTFTAVNNTEYSNAEEEEEPKKEKRESVIITEKGKVRSGKRKKRSNSGGTMSVHRDYTTSDEDIKIIRKHLAEWEKDGWLTENQIAAVNALKGRFAKLLSEEEKNQLLDVFNTVKSQYLE